MRFGVFIAPYHHVGDDPTLAFERDQQLVEWVESLGYREAWFGEHHSGGTEIIGAPELMIATAAARTRRIRLGTGVASLPNHHPFVFADRMVQLDHLTRGRLIVGVGPGALPGDAYYLLMAHEWADREATLRSYELISRYVAPQFQDSLPSLERSRDWTIRNRERLMGSARTAIEGATKQYVAERNARRAAAAADRP